MQKIYVVIPNWNGADRLAGCLDSLAAQSQSHGAVVVDNGSRDGSVELIEKNYPGVHLIKHAKNKGFAGGVNAGIRFALAEQGQYVALLNNDALADKDWLRHLVDFLDQNPGAGIATSKIMDSQKKLLDSTGDIYTIWGLPFPRGRGEPAGAQYDEQQWIFGASGGASLYRVEMLRQIGLFDEDFFAYYEDIDISFRAQLAGWRIAYVPGAVVYHQIGATSRQIKGFATYHTLKNLPWLMWKNLPWALMPHVWPRFWLAYFMIAGRALTRGQFGSLFKGILVSTALWPKKLAQRYKIQQHRQVTAEYISSIITCDLPPNAHKLRRLRGGWWKLRGKK